MKTYLTYMMMYMATIAVAQTKINIKLDHEDSSYKCNEPAVFTVMVMNGDQLHKEGIASVRLSNDGLTTISTKEVNLAVDNPFTVVETMGKPGILSLDVDVASQPKKLHRVFGAAFEPFSIQPAAPAPKDFMKFWIDEFKKYSTLQWQPELTPLSRLTNDKVDGFKIAFTAPIGKIYGFLTVPKASGKYPAIVSIPEEGPGETAAPMLEDFVYLVMNVHAYDPDIPGKSINESYKELNENGMYMYKGIPDREKTYFHNSIIGITHAVAWLRLHEKVDGRCIGFHGSGQGGGLGLMIGSLSPCLCAIVSNEPAMSDHLGYKQGHLAGWPQFCKQMKNSPEIEAMVPYYDMANFVEHIWNQVPVRIIVDLADRTCSPSSIFATYNRIESLDKAISIDNGKGHKVNSMYNKDISWMKGYLKNRIKEKQNEQHLQKVVMDKGNILFCTNRLKQLSLGIVMFASDNNEAMPAEYKWQKSIYDYIGEEIFSCPKSGKLYHYVHHSIGMGNIKAPSRVILFYEDFDNHDGKVNIAFVDGHVMSYSVDGCETIEELAEHHKLLLKAEEK